jgi:hypothetical protein
VTTNLPFENWAEAQIVWTWVRGQSAPGDVCSGRCCPVEGAIYRNFPATIPQKLERIRFFALVKGRFEATALKS